MKLAQHLDKGLWALADRTLPAVYGLLFLLLVVRNLPNEQYGVFVIVQITFLIVYQLAVNLAMAPYVKYYYETEEKLHLQSNALLLLGCAAFSAMFLLVAFRNAIADLLNIPEFAESLHFVPLLFVASFGKLVTNENFRARHRFKEIFFTDAVYFLSNLLLFSWLLAANRLTGAVQVLRCLVFSYFVSSITGLWLSRRHFYLRFRWDMPLMKKMLHFGKFTYGATVTSNFYMYADTYLVSAILNPRAVALLGAVKSFLRVFDLFRQAVNLVAFPAFARLHSEKRWSDLKATYEKGIVISTFALLAIAVGLIVLADFFFIVILDNRYPGGPNLLRAFSALALVLGWQVFGEAALFGIDRAGVPFWSRLLATAFSIALNLWLIPIMGLWGAPVASIAAATIIAIITNYFLKQEIDFSFQSIGLRSLDMMQHAKTALMRPLPRKR